MTRPAPTYGKAAPQAELDHVERAFKEDGAFALLPDLPNCLHIGDITVRDGVRPPRFTTTGHPLSRTQDPSASGAQDPGPTPHPALLDQALHATGFPGLASPE
ncbi:hypothetical protein AB0M41_44095 [Streptomyces sp. NPDC051896]|uniref:hypothetical protein n=1 Tax=Streptomyces sp. NPDC051896 TaxID=3155416 RepID=UPI00344929A9